MSIGVVVTKIMTIFPQKCVHVGIDFCYGDLRQRVGRWDLGSKRAGWLAPAACWAATVTWQACRYMIGPCLSNNIGR